MPGFIAASIAVVLVAVTGAIFRGLSATGTEDITDATTNTAIDAPTPLATTVSIPPKTVARLVSPDGEVTIGLDARFVDSAMSQIVYGNKAGFPSDLNRVAILSQSPPSIATSARFLIQALSPRAAMWCARFVGATCSDTYTLGSNPWRLSGKLTWSTNPPMICHESSFDR